ncbi:uncharacterized protein LOC126880369 [Diabrotica virgifera virgifera]|uniref:MADF domain-containing protein n=1 Tax=Diabrotica virgifera virgifera TaxID=50390 RepID=A0ABM5JQD9_DIAVI|nr:uncharacterized protein LOC126880369 [Diabrotica virgifera virgifera]
MADQILKFVQLIENYQCLYNNTLQEYSRKDVTEKAWSAVARQIQWSEADCKEKWKNIRNGFVRSLKPSPSGSSAKAKKPYYLHDVMQFVLPYIRPVQHLENTGNISLPDTAVLTQPDEDESSQVLPNENIPENNTEENNNTSVIESSKRVRETISSHRKKNKCIRQGDVVDQAVLQYVNQKKR